MHEQLKAFFGQYEERFNNALRGNEDARSTAAAFAGCFIGASPAGVQCGTNDETFLENIPKGNAFYRSIGTKRMAITDLEITPLNEMHAMVKAYWHSEYTRKDGQNISIDFDVIYLLQNRHDQWKIFAYITGDEQGEMRKNGLID